MKPQEKILAGDYPGLFQSAGNASLRAQKSYYTALRAYLFTLILAAVVSFTWPKSTHGAGLSALLFLISLGMLVWMRVRRPDDIWYNGRAVAESVKTRTWRWMMRAGPYEDSDDLETMRRKFLADIKAILIQNQDLASELCNTATLQDAITPKMIEVRALPVGDRLAIYRQERIQDQAKWYTKKAVFNRKRASYWFRASVLIHAVAIIMLLVRFKDPSLGLPVGVASSLASAVLTWLKAKKHNELSSSYSLAANEIVLIKAEGESINSESQLDEFVVSAETAFSREHTQWVASKKRA